jgi:NADH:ubiquinone oxidoreductase subunit 4 (subunit M)
MLWAVERVFFGGSKEPPRHDAAGHDHGDEKSHAVHADAEGRCDLEWYEIAALSPLAVFVLWIGLAPATFLAPPAAVLRAATRDASRSFAERMRALEDAAPINPPDHVADRIVGHDHPAIRHPLLLTSDRP